MCELSCYICALWGKRQQLIIEGWSGNGEWNPDKVMALLFVSLFKVLWDILWSLVRVVRLERYIDYRCWSLIIMVSDCYRKLWFVRDVDTHYYAQITCRLRGW